jgi:hypothetical protein
MATLSEASKQAIDIIEKIQKIGFPNTKNISAMEELVKQLQKLMPSFKNPTHQASIKYLSTSIQNIKNKLEKAGVVSVSAYTKLNAQLVVFKENLIAS